MRLFAVTTGMVSNVVAVATVFGVAVTANLQGVLHILKPQSHHMWLPMESGSLRKHIELQRFNTIRGIFGLPKLVPAYASAASCHSYRDDSRQSS